jgi:hypothetical protein
MGSHGALDASCRIRFLPALAQIKLIRVRTFGQPAERRAKRGAVDPNPSPRVAEISRRRRGQ